LESCCYGSAGDGSGRTCRLTVSGHLTACAGLHHAGIVMQRLNQVPCALQGNEQAGSSSSSKHRMVWAPAVNALTGAEWLPRQIMPIIVQHTTSRGLAQLRSGPSSPHIYNTTFVFLAFGNALGSHIHFVLHDVSEARSRVVAQPDLSPCADCHFPHQWCHSSGAVLPAGICSCSCSAYVHVPHICPIDMQEPQLLLLHILRCQQLSYAILLPVLLLLALPC
jgi:hypothetical protein